MRGGEARGAALRLAAAMAIAGTLGLFVRESGVAPADAVFWRCAIGGAAMLAWCAATGALRGALDDRRDRVLILVGGVCIVANWLLAFEAFRWVSITLATIAYHVQPFWVLLLVRLAYGERTDRHRLGWIGIAFAGLVLAVGFDPGLTADARGVLVGVALSVGAALLYAGAAVAAKGIRRAPPAVVTLAHAAMGALALGLLRMPALPEAASPAWPWLAGLGLVHTALVYVLMYGAYPRLEGAAIAVLAFVYPVTALATDALAYGTRIAPGQAVGMAAITLATLAVSRGWRLRCPGLPR